MAKLALQENMIKKVVIMGIFFEFSEKQVSEEEAKQKTTWSQALYYYYINRDSAGVVGMAGATKQAVATTRVLQQPVCFRKNGWIIWLRPSESIGCVP